MTIFLVIVAVLSYLIAAFAVLLSKSDIQIILSALCVLTGTVAVIGLAVLNRMKAMAELMVVKVAHATPADARAGKPTQAKPADYEV